MPKPTDFTSQRLTPTTATEIWSLHRHATSAFGGVPTGTTALDVAASPTGRIAVVGTFTGFFSTTVIHDTGWVQVLTP